MADLLEQRQPPVADARIFDARRFSRPDLGLALAPSFRIARSDRIAVMGNCFANQVEYKLAEWAGYRASGGGLGPVYSIRSVLQTVRWALRGGFGPEHIAEISPGVWFNGHRGTYQPFATRDEAVKSFRATLDAVGRCLREADILIVILGVVEHFRDTQTGLSWNIMPYDAWSLRFSGRAREARDTHADVPAGCLAVADEIRAVRPGVRMLWGVSPITQDATFFGPDVLVSNGYFKATLRSAVGEAVEQMRAAGAPVDYFPCYELGVLNPREKVFKEELCGRAYGRMVRGRFVRDVVVPVLLGAYGEQPAAAGDACP